MKRFLIVLTGLLFATIAAPFTKAQTLETLVGTWQAVTQGITFITEMKDDGSYTYEAVGQNYLEAGTWQLDGTAFSQQWQDPRTGAAMRETYQLEFTSETSFVQSGGNFSEPVTFTKVTDETVTATTESADNSASTSSSDQSKPVVTPTANKTGLLKFPPPEVGEYTCSSSNLSVGITFDPTGSLGDTMPVYGVNVLPSLLGNLILNGDGTYKLTQNSGSGGTYTFDAANNQLEFTGELEPFPIDYFVTDGWFTIRLNFTDEASKKVASLSCSHASANAVAPTTPTPNPGLPGTLTLHLKEGQIVNVVAETADMQLIGEGMEPFQAANGETIYVSNNGSISGYPEFTILNPDGMIAARLEIDDGSEIKEGTSIEDIFATGYGGTPTPSDPVLSPDSSLIAYSSVDSLGNQNVVVRRRTGDSSEVIATLPDMAQPTWTKDGGLIMAGGSSATGSLSTVEGIYLTDASLTTPRRIDPNLDNPLAPVLSPDGQSVAFIYGKQLWLMGAEGSNPRSLTDTLGLALYGYPTWSPDGQWLAVAAAEQNFEAWSFVLVLPASGDRAQAQRLDLPDLSPITVQRGSRIAWY